MPLQQSAPRKLMHNRAIECRGYEREDGLWDIEGHLVDTKNYATTARDTGRPRQPGEPVHNMWLRLTIDLDMKIHDAEAATDDGPYARCGAITPNFKALKGVTIGPGWRRKTLDLLGGTKGCTHLVELLGPLGTTAFQATGRARAKHNAGKPVIAKPYQLNACHMYNDDGPAVLERWPQFYTGPQRKQE
jgi:hypothetical protein